MGIDFYLSEMSVSDRHGGGLTLQRVLGGAFPVGVKLPGLPLKFIERWRGN
jgi:hypothetical protein